MQKNYDVIVVGLGTAGALSMLRCAEKGLSVLGIEKINQMGGTGTAGGICSYYFGSKGGMYEKINESAKKLRDSLYVTNGSAPAAAKGVALERAAVQAGAEFVFGARITSVLKENNAVAGITYFKDNAMHTAYTKVLIDATAEGEAARLAGCSFMGGRGFDGQYQPYTNSVFVSAPHAYIENVDAGHINMQNTKEMSRELIRANTLPVYLKDKYPRGNEKLYLANAPLPGVRESARIEGEQTVTLTQALSGTQTENTIFYAYSNIDNHGKDIAFERKELKDWYIACGLWGLNMSISVPMGALIPKGIEGLIVGGRVLSCDHEIASSVRMMSDMEKCGEAAGDMAYLSVKHNCTPKNVPYEELKVLLSETGALDEKNNVGFMRRTKEGTEKAHFPQTTEELKKNLESEYGGFGIWAARNADEKTRDLLYAWLKEGGLLYENAALALGLAGDTRAVPILRKFAQERNMRVPKTSIKYVQTVGVSAIYLLGRLGDTGAVPILEQMISDGGAFDESKTPQSEMYFAARDVSFQLVSNAVAALLDIADKNEDEKKGISDFLTKQIVNNPAFSSVITLKGNENTKDMAEKIREYIMFREK